MAMDISHANSSTLMQVPTLALALVLCFFGSKFAKIVKVPKVTFFLLIGFILGPGVSNILTLEIQHNLDFLNQIAFGLILFNIGGAFSKDLFESVGRKEFLCSLMMIPTIFVGVALLCAGGAYMTGFSPVESAVIGTLLGWISLESAPPTTLMVLKEYEAKGPISNSILIYLAISTLSAIFFFQFSVISFESLEILPSKGVGFFQGLGFHLWSFFGSAIIGFILGFLLCFWEQREKNPSEFLFAVICTILFGLFLSYYLNLDALIISLSFGFSIVNTSTVGKEIHASIKDMGLSIYALFFVLAGSHIDVVQSLGAMGVLGIVYILARVIMMPVASHFIGQIYDEDKQIAGNKGFGIYSHAGAALALVLLIKPIDHEATRTVVNIVMTSIFIFEIVGPLVLKQVLIRTGEIKSGKKDDVTRKTKTTIQELWENFTSNVSLSKPRDIETVTGIQDLIRKDVVSIKSNATVDQVSKFVNEHQFTIYPVINDRHQYLGMISIKALKIAILDPQHSQSFLNAEQLIELRTFIPENSSIMEAANIFAVSQLDVLPVVSLEKHKLVGLINYKDIVMLIKKKNLTIELAT